MSAAAFDTTSLWFTMLYGRNRIDVFRSVGGGRSATLPKRTATRSLSPSPLPSLVGVSAGREVELWDVTTATREYVGYEHPADVAILRFCGDRDVVTVCNDGVARRWRWERTGESIIAETPLTDVPVEIACDAAPSIAAFRFSDGSVALWQTPAEAISRVVLIEAGATSIALSDDGQFLLTVDRHGRLVSWDAQEGNRLAELRVTRAVARAQFMPRSLTILAILTDNSLIGLGAGRLP